MKTEPAWNEVNLFAILWCQSTATSRVTYTYPITIFNVDTSSMVNKVFHYFNMVSFCCHV